MVAISLLFCITLSGCKYVSSYSATILVHSNSSDSGYIRFSSFTGTYVFKFKYSSGSSEALHYTGKLGKGTLKVFYDDGEGKKELFTLQAGRTADASVRSLKEGTLYIIVEAENKCEDGDLTFALE